MRSTPSADAAERESARSVRVAPYMAVVLTVIAPCESRLKGEKVDNADGDKGMGEGDTCQAELRASGELTLLSALRAVVSLPVVSLLRLVVLLVLLFATANAACSERTSASRSLIF